MGTDNRQSTYHLPRSQETGDVDRDIYDAMRLYLLDLGIAASTAAERAALEVARGPAITACDALRGAGVAIEGRRVLDLGAGLGTMSEELVLRGRARHRTRARRCLGASHTATR